MDVAAVDRVVLEEKKEKHKGGLKNISLLSISIDRE